MQDLRGKRVTVFGLGHFGGGISVSRWLVEQGAVVRVTDSAPREKLEDSVRQLQHLPIEFRLGHHAREDFTDVDLVVASPAIPPANEYLRAAREKGVPVTTEIRLFVERCSAASVLGITGTKGKSTTTTLLGEMLKTRYRTWVGGNIGGSLLSELPKIQKDHLVVLELSSFMLEHLGEMRWSPHVGIITMLTQDHLQWHGSLENYIAAKGNLLRFQTASDFAILPEDNAEALAMGELTPARRATFGVEGRRRFEFSVLAGEHNQINAQAAYAAAKVMGVTWDDAQNAVRDFPGLPHRLQLVHERNGVRYYNDSIATIPEAAIAALDSFPPGKVIQIVGGHDKELQMDAMCAALAQRAKAVLAIGHLGPSLAEKTRAAGGATVQECVDLQTAVHVAREIAKSGDVVLLSTGCASYDQFTNYQERGDRFAALARENAVAT